MDKSKKTIVVYNVSEDVWLLFKSYVVRRKLTMAEALEEAIKCWIKHIEQKQVNNGKNKLPEKEPPIF